MPDCIEPCQYELDYGYDKRRGSENCRSMISGLFHEHEVNSQDQADEDQADEGGDMVPVEGLALEDQNREQGEDGQGDYFLYYLELDEVEGAAVIHETYAVGGDLEGIGQLSMSFISCSLRCPYHAKVMNTLDTISSSTV